MALITTAEYPSVRFAIDFRLNSIVMPDDIIAQPIFVVEAELDVLAILPQAASFTGTSLTRVKNAVIYLTAIKMIPSVPQLIDQSIFGDREKYELIDWEKKIDNLLDRFDENINRVGVYRNLPRVFSMDGGYKLDLKREYIYVKGDRPFPPYRDYPTLDRTTD